MSGSGAERRQWPRIPASVLTNVSASITAGPDVKLVNLSRGGALMEVAARYPMRSKVRLKVVRPGGETGQINGTVSWAKVASISNGKINYLLAVLFESPIEDLAAFTGIPDVESHATLPSEADPVFDQPDLPATVVAGAARTDTARTDPAPEAHPEEDLSSQVFTATPAVATAPASVDVDQIQAIADAQERAAAAEARMGALQGELERTAADLSALSAANDNLSAQLAAFDDERVRMRGELQAVRSQWEQERSELVNAAAASASRLQELQSALQQQHHSGGQALADHQALVHALSSRIETLEAERGALRNDLDAERLGRQEDRAAASRELDQVASDRRDLEARLEAEQRERIQERAALEQTASEAAIRLQDAQQMLQQLSEEYERALALGRAADGLRGRVAELEEAHAATQAALETERQARDQERADLIRQLTESRGQVEELHRGFEEKEAEHIRAVAEQQAIALALRAQLEELTSERADARRTLEAERAQWASERARSESEAQARSEEFQAALEAREQVHAEVLADANRRFEALVEELMQSSNEQQAEYQQLMAERTAALEEQVTRAERLHGELVSVRSGFDAQRAALEHRCRELQAGLAAAEAVSAAYETRHRAIRQEAERLVSLLAPNTLELHARDVGGLSTAGDVGQAVAGG